MQAHASIPVGPPIATPLPSYWHSKPSPLANLIQPNANNTTQPFKKYDYMIIGSGISGAMLAYNILTSHPRSSVLMLEARGICSGATGRNGGHTKAASYRSYLQNKEDLGREEALRIVRLEWECIVATHRLAEETGLRGEADMCRTVDVIYDAGVWEAGKRAIEELKADADVEECKEGGMAWYEIHEAGEEGVLETFHVARTNGNPAVQVEEKVQGVFEYMAGRIHAYRFTTTILQKCVKLGLQICTHTPVHSVIPSSSTTDAWDVHTQFGSATTSNVILATNGYTSYLLKEMQGVIVPMRGQITAQRPGLGNTLTTPLPTTYSFIYKSGYEYMIPRPLEDEGQHIVIGGGLGRLPEHGASEYGTVDDGSLNPQVSEYLRESLTGYFGVQHWGEKTEDDASQRVVQEWTGIMGATADGRPYVGEIPGKKGMWICAGFNGHGMVLCLKAAEALVQMMGGGRRPEWFPESFLVSEERVAKARFTGRTDMKVPTPA